MDLGGFWRRAEVVSVAEFDQKAALAMDLIVREFGIQTEALVEAIGYFARSDRVVISIIGLLAEAGLAAIAVEEARAAREIRSG